MPKIIATADGVKTEHELPEQRLTVVVAQPGIRVDVPDFVEVNGRTTLKTMEEMSQKAWTYISTGPLFQALWLKAFPPDEVSMKIPATIQELNEGDFANIHIAGMIVQCCEAVFAGRKVFLREPETHLHPKIERTVMSMISMIIAMGNASGTEVAIADPAKDKADCIAWLTAMEPMTNENLTERAIKVGNTSKVGKVIAHSGDTPITVEEALEHVQKDTVIGKQIIEEFVKKRDKGFG